MIKTGAMIATAAKAVRTDLKRSWYDWDTLQKKVIVKRRERQAVNGQFAEQVQEIPTDYFVVDVRWRCDGAREIKQLFVAGLADGGDSVIERFRFRYAKTIRGTPYVPIDPRPLPAVQKTEIYRGSSLGRIRTLQPDPAGRFVLFLTRETPALYRISLSGNAFNSTVELSQSTVPYLASSGVINLRQHVSEGRHYHLYAGNRWEYDATLPSDTIILRDGDDDGVFDPAEVVTRQQWSQYGYDSPGAWVKICQ